MRPIGKLSKNGTLAINSTNDTNIAGGNLLASNIILTAQKDLNVTSKQSEEDYSSSGFGFSVGTGFGFGTNGDNVNYGFNVSSGNMHRLWVDDITSITATNDMEINAGQDFNLTGAAILSDNMNLNIAGNINKTDLQDSYYSESLGFGISQNFVFGGEQVNGAQKTASQPTEVGQGAKPNNDPRGSSAISGNYGQNESSRTTYATIGNLDSELFSNTTEMNNGDFSGSITVDHRLLSEGGRRQINKEAKELGKNLNKNPLSPMGYSIVHENYTKQELTLASGDVARFKEKGREFETAVVGANTIGMANVIPTNPTDPDYDASRLHLIGQPLSADPKYYKNSLTWANEGGFVSSANVIPGFNSMSIFHDKFTEETFLGESGLLQLSIIPAIPITYYALIGKSLRGLYEEPQNTNLTGNVK